MHVGSLQCCCCSVIVFSADFCPSDPIQPVPWMLLLVQQWLFLRSAPNTCFPVKEQSLFCLNSRKLGTAGQKLGGSAVLCHIKHDPMDPGGCFTLTSANVGKCQTVLCRNGKPLPLSRCYVMSCEEELKRIKQHKAIITEVREQLGTVAACSFFEEHLHSSTWNCMLISLTSRRWCSWCGFLSCIFPFKVIHTMQSSCFSIPLPCWILISFQEWAAVSMLHWNRKADTLLLMGEELLCWNCHGELFQLKRMRGQSTWSNAVLPLGDSLLLADWLCCLSYVPRTALWQAALEECTCPKGKLTLCSAEPNYLFLS